jgi:hypothetical protein
MGVKRSVIFYNQKHQDSNEIEIEPGSLLIHGDSVDDRGESTLNLKNKNIDNRIEVSYDFNNMKITIGNDECDADFSKELFDKHLFGKKIVLEATTLGFPELFLVIEYLVVSGIEQFLVLYVEPQEYNKESSNSDFFALSELNAGYIPIPKSIIDLSSKDVEAGVFFLGFESNRLEKAFEEYQMLAAKEVKVVIGVPAFQPGWELNSIVPHLNILDDFDVAYCAANDPDSAFDTLEETRESLKIGGKMFVGPIGTKPCSIASAIFASIYPNQVGLLHDHRIKSPKRSIGVHVWHSYHVTVS